MALPRTWLILLHVLLQEKETTMLVDEVTREGHEARTPAAPLVSNEPQLWGSVFPSADDDQAFTNSE